MGFFAYDLFAGIHFEDGKEQSPTPVIDDNKVPTPGWVGKRSTEFGQDSADVIRFKGWFNFQDRAGIWVRQANARLCTAEEATTNALDRMW